MRNRKDSLAPTFVLCVLVLLLSYIPSQIQAAGVDLGLCDPAHISCRCGSSGRVNVQIPACTWFYRWRPYCKACEPDIDESALCAQYTNCLECSNVRGQGCTRCPPGRAGRQCNEVPARVNNTPPPPPSTTSSPQGYCESHNNRYEPVEGCRRFKQYILRDGRALLAGTLPCPGGLLFDVNACTCNYADQVTCSGGEEGPQMCQVPAPNSFPNGRIVLTGAPDSDGQTIRYECDDGYQLRGASTNECVNGGWANAAPRCVPEPRPSMCSVPNLPANAAVVSEQHPLPNTFAIGTTLRIGCNHGYELSGSQEIVCDPNARWQIDEPITCSAAANSCEDPGTPRNGRRRVVEPRIAGSRRIGSPRRRSRLGYHGRTRSRLGRQASSPFVPDGHFAFDTRLVFSCENRHYELVGSRIRACRNGQWSGRQPACIPVCGKAGGSRTAFITNGNATVKGQWPWQVAVSRNDLPPNVGTFNLVCGGALLTEHWIVTAAHCVTERETGELIRPNHFKIHLGRHYRDLSRADVFVQEFEVDHIIKQEEYDHVILDSDIALIRLAGSGAQFSERVRPVCLSDSEEEGTSRLQPGNEGVVIGWGRTETNTNAGSLRQAYIPVIDSRDCEDSYLERLGINVPVTGNMFCAGFERGGIDACAGDSGGPMIFSDGRGDDQQWFLEGLVSWGSPTGECGSPAEYGGYTKVSKFLDWINENISL